MAVLSLDRQSKRYGARLAVDAVSFEVQDREVLSAFFRIIGMCSSIEKR